MRQDLSVNEDFRSMYERPVQSFLASMKKVARAAAHTDQGNHTMLKCILGTYFDDVINLCDKIAARYANAAMLSPFNDKTVSECFTFSGWDYAVIEGREPQQSSQPVAMRKIENSIGLSSFLGGVGKAILDEAMDSICLVVRLSLV